MMPGRQHRVVAITLILAGAIGLRLWLIVVRPPFFDELFTRWIAAMDPSSLIAALALDSGPPLYYLLLSPFRADEVIVLRLLSLPLAMLAFLALPLATRDTTERVIGTLLLAALPIHVYFSSEARAYALLTALAGLACAFLYRWQAVTHWRWPAAASMALVAAGYTHWYGFVFFPLLAVAALMHRVRDSRRTVLVQAAVCSVAIAISMIPALILLSRQPSDASDWMRRVDAGAVSNVLGQVPRQLGPAQALHPALAPEPPATVVLISAVLALLLFGNGVVRSREARFWAAMVLVPVAGVLILIAAGQPAYFRGRFESSLSIPLVMLAATSIGSLRGRLRWGALASWTLLSISVVAGWLAGYGRMSEDPWRLVASFARAAVPGQGVILATGPMYLELISQRDDEWRPVVLGFPAEQARHPGWRAESDPQVLAEDLKALPTGARWWAGDRDGIEQRALAQHYEVTPAFAVGPVVLAELRPRQPGSVDQAQEKHRRESDDEKDSDQPVRR